MQEKENGPLHLALLAQCLGGDCLLCLSAEERPPALCSRGEQKERGGGFVIPVSLGGGI
jgi:hypothetical protein